MNTVKSFKEKEGELVKGDGVGSSLISDVHYMDDANIWNLGSKGDEDVIRSFAWRTNTGVKPEYEGLIEYKTADGDCDISPEDELDFSIDGHLADIVKWRPHLEDNTSTPEEDEAFNRMEEVKPAFTQEFVKVGAILMYTFNVYGDGPWYKCKIMDIGVVGFTVHCPHLEDDCDAGVRHFSHGGLVFEEIRTPKQKAVDNAAHVIEMKHGSAGSAYKKYCETLYDSGLLKDAE